MAKASKKRGKKKAAKRTKKKTRARKPAKRTPAKRTPSKRKGSKRKPAKKPARKQPPQPQTEPWPMIFAVLLAMAVAVVAAWHFNGAAEAATAMGAAVDAGRDAAIALCGYAEAQPALAPAVPPPQLN